MSSATCTATRWQWVFRRRCGCPFGVHEGQYGQPASRAWFAIYGTHQSIDLALDLGNTVELLAHSRYEADVVEALTAAARRPLTHPCDHLWLLRIPAPAPMLSANTSLHWLATASARRQWRSATCVHARQARVPTNLSQVRIDVVLHPTSARRRDAANLHPYVVKPIVDGLGPARRVRDRDGGIRVEPGHGLIPDDTREFLDGPYPHLGDPVSKRDYHFGLAVVHITDLSHEVTGHAETEHREP